MAGDAEPTNEVKAAEKTADTNKAEKDVDAKDVETKEVETKKEETKTEDTKTEENKEEKADAKIEEEKEEQADAKTDEVEKGKPEETKAEEEKEEAVTEEEEAVTEEEEAETKSEDGKEEDNVEVLKGKPEETKAEEEKEAVTEEEEAVTEEEETETKSEDGKEEDNMEVDKGKPEETKAEEEKEEAVTEEEEAMTEEKDETKSEGGKEEENVEADNAKPEDAKVDGEGETQTEQKKIDADNGEVEPDRSEEKAGDDGAKTEQMEVDEEKTDKENGEEKKDAKVEQNKCPALEKKIIKQLEFYFGDFNLGKDKFLQGQVRQDNGWVSLEVLLTFNRLKSLSEDAAYISECVGNSTTGLLVVSDDKLKIRRSPDRPLPEETKTRRDGLKARSVYVKGFPLNLTLEEVEVFFEPHGEIEHIQMRRDRDRVFKGSVFVIFGKPEDATKFVEAESLKHEEAELKRLLKDDYFKMKMDERKTRKEVNLQEAEDKKKANEVEAEAKLHARITKGSVLYLAGLPDGLSVDELRTAFGDFGEVAWVEYEKGDSKARVRYASEDEAKAALKKAQEGDEATIKVKDTSVKAHVLEGDEELDYWKSMFQSQRERRERESRSGRGKRGRGGRGGWRGGPPAKKRRTH